MYKTFAVRIYDTGVFNILYTSRVPLKLLFYFGLSLS